MEINFSGKNLIRGSQTEKTVKRHFTPFNGAAKPIS